MSLDKAYDSQKYEDKIYKKWEESGLFNPDVCVEKGIAEENAPYFSLVLPPPNATGALHAGHAMMLAIEDALTRYYRMKGYRALWIPGTDHAAIATNAVVEKRLLKEGKTKHDLGREKYVEAVKDYIENSKNNIRNQVRKMGSSLDWSREAYTWDEPRNLSVKTMFKKMYDDGLIYRGYRIVNWCPFCQSTIADDEVEYQEQNAKLYYFKYSKDFPITIATTRPETKLGDTAVAVNPEDERYSKYIGQEFIVKIDGVERKIKIIADANVESGFGTGALGVTPAHSFVDYEMAQKYNLEIVKIIGEDGKMTEDAGKYFGLTVKEAREKLVSWLETEGLMEKVEELNNNLSCCYRCHRPIEPLPSKQWFVDVNKEFKFNLSKEHPISGIKDGQKITIKEVMQHVVKSGQIKIIPERFEKIYFNWIDNLRDWCISRQLWVGHQIPVYYRKLENSKTQNPPEGVRDPDQHRENSKIDENNEIYVGVNPPEGEGWEQDPDTLDTWFSSGMWTFSTLGWPDENARDLKTFHPTDVLETMHDLIFFWVARMIMMTTYALGEVPFKTVYFHAKVLDRDGEKMSKSKPETMIEPVSVCQKFGTDAVRLSMLYGVAPAADMRLSEEKIENMRNFTNKLWNISRFMLINIENTKMDCAVPTAKTNADQWILNKLHQLTLKTEESFQKYNFSQAVENLMTFTWDDLADWYLEIAKVESGSASAEATPDKTNKSLVLNYILNTLLKLWHPFMPFVTEAIWQETYGEDQMLMVAKYPETNQKENKDEVSDFENVVLKTITSIRSCRGDYKIDPVKKMNAVISAGDKEEILSQNSEVIKRLARLESLQINKSTDKPINHIGLVVGGIEIFIDVEGVLDIEKEKSRLNKEIEEAKKYFNSLEKKLTNQEFVKNAPEAVIQKEKAKMDETKTKIEKLESQLKNL